MPCGLCTRVADDHRQQEPWRKIKRGEAREHQHQYYFIIIISASAA